MRADATTQAEVKATLQAFADAYADRDLERVRACFARDDDVLLYGTGADERRLGLAEIEVQAKRDWAQTESASMVFESMVVSAAGPVAWAAVDGAFELRAQGHDLRLPVRITFVLEKRDRQWLIVHAHCSLPSASQEEGHSF